ncbi:hypothetical protein COY52_09900 [Candidatus Desantisbacteria bacterium CG_4_10_14_0_8_um_filter_48_22]|uniref:O-antigen ligase-related domain-containing protein n=1 Tax=Candidatus Desantisbacteria bacterium CG_4_10_14_0_8_um_filter_48_22 TaxID=1974543 RepID=A0A2M7S7D8_9BACT|nr:MAG: hypothetical protein AUJ67_05140 [Candidatus Desantisbacteria bacterium CG1_02_49_89]PIV56225.1 MAG: hypothetical protein COS16_04625 [Candidatus Desantisbacteria bacterium CG02_land_8_20_14_3_00_49_13]PIZ15389.1 MAG: hypothetical protein COY52_09900 [Candidatus Desantisbacteria bacterium CG_4_10_14_0_8_um_filter_48_22]
MIAKIFLSLLPLAILGITPRSWTASVIGTAGYCLAAFVSSVSGQNGKRSEGLSWVYVSAIGIFLLAEMLFNPSMNGYGTEKGFYFLLIVLPFSLAASRLVRAPEDFRFVMLGFLPLGLVLALMTVVLNRPILGISRYSWTGNLCAISAVILLQFKIIKNKMIAFLLFLLSSAGVAVSASKQAAVMLVAGFAATLLFNCFDLKRRKKDILILSAIVLVLVFFWNQFTGLPVMHHLMGRIQHSMRFDDRVLMLPAAWNGFLASPFAGIGIGNYAEIYTDFSYFYPHNIFLEILCEFGAAGMIIFFLPIILLCVFLISKWSKTGNDYYRYLFLFFLCFLVVANFGGDFQSNRGVWVFGIMMFGFLSFPKYAGNNTQDGR